METNRKRSKVVMLPTEDYNSPIVLNTPNKELMLFDKIINYKNLKTIKIKNSSFEEWDKCMIPQHLYVTSDEQPEIGDIAHEANSNKIWLLTLPPQKDGIWRKVIASTDSETELPQPSQAFIKKYCELGGIDEVDVEYELTCCKRYSSCNMKCSKVMIPKVDSHNTITIHSIKDSWSREEVEQKCIEAFNAGYAYAGGFILEYDKYALDEEEWIKENL